MGPKIAAVLTTAMGYGVLAFIFVFRFEVIYTYSFYIQGVGSSLPSLTLAVSLPLLGLTHGGFWENCLFWSTWIILWVAPLAILLQFLRTRDAVSALQVWVLGFSLYAVLLFGVLILIALGLWLPFMMA